MPPRALSNHQSGMFKTCSNCHARWESLDAFIRDPAVDIVGYMPTFDDLLRGLFFFHHNCGTTLACRVEAFEHLYDGPVYQEKKTGQTECPGYCQHKSNLAPCPVECNCAFVREVMQIIRKMSGGNGRIPQDGGRSWGSTNWSVT